jgi:hypothetical protein
MTSQELLFTAHKHGVSVTTDGKGNLQAAPAHLLTPKRIGELKAYKRQLLPLVTDLERYGALNDSIILEALALFDAHIAEVTQRTPVAEQACFNLAA